MPTVIWSLGDISLHNHRRKQRGHAPLQIFIISSQFVLWEAMSQTKYCCLPKVKICAPQTFWACYAIVHNTNKFRGEASELFENLRSVFGWIHKDRMLCNILSPEWPNVMISRFSFGLLVSYRPTNSEKNNGRLNSVNWDKIFGNLFHETWKYFLVTLTASHLPV